MLKDVMITIEGQQEGSEEEPIIERASGTYHFKNGKHYVQYEEILKEQKVISKNLIKVVPTQVVISKKLLQSSQMVFDLKEVTQTVYQTPYGDMTFDINTSSILISEDENCMEVILEYSLSMNASHVSNNRTRITIAPNG